jgi:hypothetical protein
MNNQRDATFVLFGLLSLLSLYMFRTRFASIFRSNYKNVLAQDPITHTILTISLQHLQIPQEIELPHPTRMTHTSGCQYIFVIIPEDGREPRPKHVE